jgi:hypothetical protein
MSEQAGYSGTPLVRKLGIKPGQLVLMIDAPEGFDLGTLPDGVAVDARQDGSRYDVVVVFCPDRAALERWFEPLMTALGPTSALWVAWPKKASKVPTDLDENVVRDHGLAAGLVDVKVCAVDAVWSGLKFVYRLADRPMVSSTQA